MAKKPEVICMFCDNIPCVCHKKAKVIAKPTIVSVVPEPAVQSAGQVPKRITAPPPDGLVFKTPEPVKTEHKLVTRNLTEIELVEITALKNLAKAGLISARENPEISGLLTMELTPLERAKAWRCML